MFQLFHHQFDDCVFQSVLKRHQCFSSNMSLWGRWHQVLVGRCRATPLAVSIPTRSSAELRVMSH